MALFGGWPRQPSQQLTIGSPLCPAAGLCSREALTHRHVLTAHTRTCAHTHTHTHFMDCTSDWPCTPSLSSSWPLDSLVSQWPHAQRYTCKSSLSASWSSPMALPVAYHETPWLLQLMAWTPDLSSSHLPDPLVSSVPSPDLRPLWHWLLSLSSYLPFHSASCSLTISHWPIQYTGTWVCPAPATADTHASVLSVSSCQHSPCHCLMPLGSPCKWR